MPQTTTPTPDNQQAPPEQYPDQAAATAQANPQQPEQSGHAPAQTATAQDADSYHTTHADDRQDQAAAAPHRSYGNPQTSPQQPLTFSHDLGK